MSELAAMIVSILSIPLWIGLQILVYTKVNDLAEARAWIAILSFLLIAIGVGYLFPS